MGGGNLTSRLCTLPKGGAARDREKYGGPMPVPRGGLLTNREPHTSSRELARHKLGAGEGAYAVGCQRRIPRKQRRRRGTAYADSVRDAAASASTSWLVVCISGRTVFTICGDSTLRQSRQYEYNDQTDGRRSAAQQFATVSRGVYLAADGLSTPERGRAVCWMCDVYAFTIMGAQMLAVQ